VSVGDELGVKIGLEIHCQMSNLKTKLFCRCPSDYRGKEPNTVVCPVCLGLPGALPVVNENAVRMGIRAALALNSKISRRTYFYRKHYFYPDLPKGYQISQYDLAGAVPFARGGYLDITVGGKTKRIRIRRIQIEEDPAKLTYKGASIDEAQYTMVDYNRSGVALLEIITEPDLSSAEEAAEFLRKLRNILEHIGVFDGSLEGVMRVDVNISIGSGARVEIKNLSSIKDIERAISFEVLRQSRFVKEGIKIRQETLHWDDKARKTYTLRVKEEAHDYRYFPDPNLPPLVITEEMIERERREMPYLPEIYLNKLVGEYGIPEAVAKTVVQDAALSRFLDACVARGGEPLDVAKWLLRIYRKDKEEILERWDVEGFVSLTKLFRRYEVPEDAGPRLIHDYLAGASLAEIEEKAKRIATSRAELEGEIVALLRTIEIPEDLLEKAGKDEGKLREYVIGQVRRRLMASHGGLLDSKFVAETVLKNFSIVRERAGKAEAVEVVAEGRPAEKAEAKAVVESLGGWKRTHFNDEITPEMEGEKVTVFGWVQKVDRLGKLYFIVLRDASGIIQVKVSRRESPPEIIEKVQNLTVESVVAVRGVVKADKRAPTGVEIVPEELKILSLSEKLPYTHKQAREVGLPTRLDYRYLDIRRESVRAIFRVRSTVLDSMRRFFRERRFTEINTPKIIAAAAEGGAELFLLLFYGSKAYLSQSPQLYKQLAISGFERVFEIGPCYRAEKFHTTKHLVEFWALDVEVAFATYYDLMEILEDLMRRLYEDVNRERARELELLGVKLVPPRKPFPKITYDEALEIAESYGYKVEWGDDIRGEAFRAVCRHFADKGHEFYFIIDFPTSARAFYYQLHEDNPKLTKSFDLVNTVKGGIELSSGGERINDRETLIRRLREKGLKPEDYTWYLNMFRYGVPPHGGFGLGIERLLQAMLRLDNIMEAVLLPRTPQRLRP